MNKQDWDELGEGVGLPISAETRTGLGWVLHYEHKTTGKVWQLPIFKFADTITPRKTRVQSRNHGRSDECELESSTLVYTAMGDGCELFMADSVGGNVGEFEFKGIRYVGEKAYVEAYATFLDTWPEGEEL